MDPMLIETGLFGRGLVTINTPKGAAMYNEALVDLGLPPTALKQFNIDGIGWSPEIAVERGDPGYLGHGPANRVAIIATPDQDRKPIFLPTYSFKRRLMQNFFARSMREIADITQSTCLRLEFENHMLDYQSPRDLLFIDEVTLLSSAGMLTEVAHAQRELVSSCAGPGLDWSDARLRAGIMASAAAHGDLRRRRIEIPPFKFSLMGNFWSRVFGGVFVLLAGADKILIVEDESWLDKVTPAKGERYHAFSISQPKDLIGHLLDEHLIEFDLKFYQEHPEEIESLKNYIIADCICRADPECDLYAMSPSRRKSVIIAHKATMPEYLSELEVFQRAVSGRLGGRQKPKLSEELALMLLRPAMRAGDNAHTILRMLLLRLQDNPVDLMRLYRYDKERFFALFETWPPSKKRWAAKYIMANYRPEMGRQ